MNNTKKLIMENRIATMKARDKENSNIIRKLLRKMRKQA